MPSIVSEHLLTLTAAAGEMPNAPSEDTVRRWAHRGLRGVRLETVMLGGRRYTSREAVVRFISATTAAAEGGRHG